MTIPKIVGYFKMNSAKAVNQFRNTIGSPFWQRNYYEHIIRDENDLNSIREYIIINPVKWHVDPENPIFIKDNSLQ
jgi:REP element-mobilizing transposase RayT